MIAPATGGETSAPFPFDLISAVCPGRDHDVDGICDWREERQYDSALVRVGIYAADGQGRPQDDDRQRSPGQPAFKPVAKPQRDHGDHRRVGTHEQGHERDVDPFDGRVVDAGVDDEEGTGEQETGDRPAIHLT
jgi:hypothetical protein